MCWHLYSVDNRPNVAAEVRNFIAQLVASDPAGGLNTQIPSSMPGQPAPLAAPTNLTATANGAVVTLKWNDVATTNTGYKIERRAALGPRGLIGLYAPIGTVGADATGFVDRTAAADTEYDYLVRAHDATRDSACAGPATVQTGADKGTAPTGGSARATNTASGR